jgi:cytochrome c551/c552
MESTCHLKEVLSHPLRDGTQGTLRRLQDKSQKTSEGIISGDMEMKKHEIVFLVAILAGMISLPKGVSAEGGIGSQLVEERGCGACHDRTEDQTLYRLGPSWEQIAEAYKGREEDMEAFLKGGCDPIVDEARFEIMHGEIVKMKGLSDSQIRDLRKYICGEQ